MRALVCKLFMSMHINNYGSLCLHDVLVSHPDYFYSPHAHPPEEGLGTRLII